MLLLGHIGITAGIIKGCAILAAPAKPDNNRWWHRIISRAGAIDYRMVVIGSLLPDIIDKPAWFLANTVTSRPYLSGRDYVHTLLFNLVLLAGGFILLRYRKSWLLVPSLGSFAHLILDQLWQSPAVLLWPLLGPLVREETAGWLPGTLQALFSQPEVYVPEIIGLIIIALFACRLVTRKGITGFVRDGAIG